MTKKKRIFGVDPGTVVTGYGVVDYSEGRYSAVDYGCIRIPTEWPLPERYFAIFEALVSLMKSYNPDDVILETQFVHKNAQSALKVGMARGVAIVAARQGGASVFEYTPSSVKLAVTGSGRASKAQVQLMTQRLLKLASLPTPYDAADALALAIHHTHHLQASRKL